MTTPAETLTGGPQVRDLESPTTAAVRVTRTMADLPAAFGEFLPKVAERASQAGLSMTDPPYARYHAMGEEIDVEIGAPVSGPPGALPPLADVAMGEVGLSSLPGGRAVVTTYVGPYSGLGDAWHELDRWLHDQGLERTGPGWESYIDDPYEIAPEALRTEIVLPVG
jgi:effector-binding domain-containing protein